MPSRVGELNGVNGLYCIDRGIAARQSRILGHFPILVKIVRLHQDKMNCVVVVSCWVQYKDIDCVALLCVALRCFASQSNKSHHANGQALAA